MSDDEREFSGIPGVNEDDADAAFEAEQAKRLAREKRIEEAEARSKKEQRHAELDAMKKATENRDQERKEVQKSRESAKEKKREVKNGIDSDDDDAKEDEAMEQEESDHDDENSDPPEGESDKEGTDESDSSSAIATQVKRQKHEERARRKATSKFIDMEAELSENDTEEYVKGLKKKHTKKKYQDELSDDDATPSDKEAIEEEGVVRYDTDTEEDLKGKKPKGKNKRKKRKRVVSSDEEEESSNEKEEPKKEKNEAQVFETKDSDIENMVALETENATNRKSAKFPEHGDIAKATADKKNKPMDPASLLDSPKKATKEKKPKNSPANGGGKKKAAAAKNGDRPAYKVGEEIELAGKVYIVTHRSEDFPMVRGNRGLEFDRMCCDITRLSTAEKVEISPEDGSYKHTGQFELFFINKETTKPRKLAQIGTQAIWDQFMEKFPDKANKMVLQACTCENVYEKKRLLIPSNVWKKISKDCVKVSGDWKWVPKVQKGKAPVEPLPPAAPTMSPQASFSSRVEKVATPPGSGRQKEKPVAAAAGTPRSNKVPAKKPKTTHNNENGTRDIALMLQRHPPSKSSASPMEDDIFASMFAPPRKLDMFENGQAFMGKLLAEAVKAMLTACPGKEELKKQFTEAGNKARELRDTELRTGEKLVILQDMMGYQRGKEAHPLIGVMHFLPWVNKEAADAVREIIFGRS
jgi:hypothetical protein